MGQTHITFFTDIGRQKPETIRNRHHPCPFCSPDIEEQVIAREGSILLVKNKYPVLKDAFQTVLIETDQCDTDLSRYPKEHLYKVIRFGIDKWMELENSGDFASVVFFKNHGPLSGGSIAHPHMQIIGLTHVDYRNTVREEHFEGVSVDSGFGVDFNISTRPRTGFYEFNVTLRDPSALDVMADYIQAGVHYVLNHFPYPCGSYNLFFYRMDGTIRVKIVPRFVTAPLLIGYSIPQVADNLTWMAEQIRKRYLSGKRVKLDIQTHSG